MAVWYDGPSGRECKQGRPEGPKAEPRSKDGPHLACTGQELMAEDGLELATQNESKEMPGAWKGVCVCVCDLKADLQNVEAM